MNYFTNCKTVEEIKAEYRKLAKQNHPDLGGSIEAMQEINSQYQNALKGCHGQETDGRTYNYKPDVERELMDKINELLRLKKVDIALIGYWIWVTGDTKENKEALKTAGLKWHSKRKCWYYKPQGWKTSRRSNGDLSELAYKYGYKRFKTADKEQMPSRV